MPPTSLTRPPAGCFPNSHTQLWFRWIAAPLLTFVTATAGCQSDRKSSSHRLPPEKELRQYTDETPQTMVDPRRLSREELEVHDGVKALKDVEENGVKVKE